MYVANFCFPPRAASTFPVNCRVTVPDTTPFKARCQPARPYQDRQDLRDRCCRARAQACPGGGPQARAVQDQRHAEHRLAGSASRCPPKQGAIVLAAT